jgi:hypothetical protein
MLRGVGRCRSVRLEQKKINDLISILPRLLTFTLALSLSLFESNTYDRENWLLVGPIALFDFLNFFLVFFFLITGDMNSTLCFVKGCAPDVSSSSKTSFFLLSSTRFAIEGGSFESFKSSSARSFLFKALKEFLTIFFTFFYFFALHFHLK